MNKFIVLLLVLLIACMPDIDTPDNDMSCFGFDGDYPIVSANPCLDGPWTDNPKDAIIQSVPDGWQLTNILENADGVEDDLTAPFPIECDEYSCTIEFHNSVTGIDGITQLDQDIEFEPGCKLWKVTGFSQINDTRNENNFVVSAYVDGEIISQQELPRQGEFELIYPFMIEEGGSHNVSVQIAALWGTAGHGSKFHLIGLGILEVPADFCD